MSWAAIAAAAGAVVSYVGSERSNSAAARANRQAGRVDIYHENTPWGPSAPLREDVMGAASNLWHSRDQRWGSGPPGLAESAAAGYGANGAAGRRRVGAAGRAPGAAGASTNRTGRIADALRDRAMAGHQLYQPANDYVQDTLEGGDRNSYRVNAAGRYDSLIDMLQQNLAGGGGLGGGDGLGGGGYSYRSGGGGAGTGGGGGPVGAAKYTREILDGKYLNEGNPYRDELINRITDRSRQEFAEGELRGINSRFSGTGRFGSSAWQDSMAKAAGRLGDSLSGTVAQVNYQDYNDRMAQIDNALGIGAQLDMNAENAAASGAASGAAAYGAEQERMSRERLAMLSALTGGIGGLSDLSADYSGDQRFALGAVPDLSGLDVRDLGAAGSLSLSIDDLMSQDRARRASAGAQRQALALQRRGLDFDMWRYGQEAPYGQLGSYADIINAMSGAYGTSHDIGTDRRNYGQQPYSNSFQQGLSGAVAGYQLGGMFGGGG